MSLSWCMAMPSAEGGWVEVDCAGEAPGRRQTQVSTANRTLIFMMTSSGLISKFGVDVESTLFLVRFDLASGR
jgi:hypothetical protein